MENILRQIDHNISKKKIQILNEEYSHMNKELDDTLLELTKIKKVYHEVLDKVKPVGKGLSAVKYLRS